MQVSGVLVEEQHGCIDCVDGVLTLRTFAETYVNGQLVSSALRLHHGDRIIIAGTHYFHLHNPKDVECPSKTSIHVRSLSSIRTLFAVSFEMFMKGKDDMIATDWNKDFNR